MTGTVENIEARLALIAERNKALNSFLRIDAEAARRDAIASDLRRDSNASGLLEGLPVAVKDNLAVAGAPWTAGVAGRRDLIAREDATAVSRLRGAGAILLGGLNMEEAALGAVTDNPTFGRCENPLRPGFTPGGSSGGSAAAVAAGLVDLALGSDTMGSVRIPAAYCGIAGLKPTFGLIGRSGLAMLAPSLDTIGPLARDAALLWPAVQALAGRDMGDPDSLATPDGWDLRPEISDLTGLRFGTPGQLALVDCEPEVLEGLALARRAIEALGGHIVDIDMPGWRPDRARHAGLLAIEAEGAVELADLMRVEGALSPGLIRMLTYGESLTAEKLVSAYAEIRHAGAAVAAAWDQVDALVTPTAPQRAFAHGTPAPANQAELSAMANFAGCPALSLPVWSGEDALPASVQLISPKLSEARLTAWAEMLEAALREGD